MHTKGRRKQMCFLSTSFSAKHPTLVNSHLFFLPHRGKKGWFRASSTTPTPPSTSVNSRIRLMSSRQRWAQTSGRKGGGIHQGVGVVWLLVSSLLASVSTLHQVTAACFSFWRFNIYCLQSKNTNTPPSVSPFLLPSCLFLCRASSWRTDISDWGLQNCWFPQELIEIRSQLLRCESTRWLATSWNSLQRSSKDSHHEHRKEISVGEN